MNARFSKCLVSVVLIAALALAIVPFAGAQEGAVKHAGVRIGYFAFDPYEVDTLVDGKLAPGGGWNEGWWLCFYPEQDKPYVFWGFSATPYLNIPSGTHEFTFVPKGANLDEAILGPQGVVLEAGHRYELAVVGELEDNSLKLLVIDETVEFAEADPSADQMVLLLHDIKGAPPIRHELDFQATVEDLAYGQFATYSFAGENQAAYWRVRTSEVPRMELMFFTTVPLPGGISEFGGLIGSYPGQWGDDFSVVTNWWYVEETTVLDGGMVAVGDDIAGEIPKIGTRVKYILTLDVDTALNIYAKATGPRTDDASGMKFDPVLYIYDAEDNTLFWNDEYSISHLSLDAEGIWDAGLEGVEVAAGNYSIEVGGGGDFNAGPYTLIVESVASE